MELEKENARFRITGYNVGRLMEHTYMTILPVSCQLSTYV
jgi:hypothetical protein